MLAINSEIFKQTCGSDKTHPWVSACVCELLDISRSGSNYWTGPNGWVMVSEMAAILRLALFWFQTIGWTRKNEVKT